MTTTNNYGVPLDRLTVGQRVRLDSDTGFLTAVIRRMDTPTFGVIEVFPEHMQGQSYRVPFHVDEVTALVETEETP